jgi:hypothetical protein
MALGSNDLASSLAGVDAVWGLIFGASFIVGFGHPQKCFKVGED